MGELKDCGWKKAEEKKEAEVTNKDGDHEKKDGDHEIKMVTMKKYNDRIKKDDDDRSQRTISGRSSTSWTLTRVVPSPKG